MHARYFNPVPGKFLSVDAVGGRLRLPQSWNRYAYGFANPISFLDRTGLAPEPYIWGQYRFRFDSAHGGPHIDVDLRTRGNWVQISRVSQETGELIPHMRKTGYLPRRAEKFMRSKGWIPSLALATAAAWADMVLTASPADAIELPPADPNASRAIDAILSIEAMNLFGGPRRLESLSDQEWQELVKHIENKLSPNEAAETPKKNSTPPKHLFQPGGILCTDTGVCF